MTGSTSSRDTRLLYVGWTGKQNLGDDAIAEALLPSLPAVEPWHVPHEPAAFARRVFNGGLLGASRHGVLVGGGTVIGRRNWRLLLGATGVLLARSSPWYLIGIGVEDPAFQGKNSFSGKDELSRWASVCERFDRVTVRGPRSVELLASIGVDADLVGDPALLHELPGEVEPREKLLGVNLGFGDDLWGHDHDRVVEAVAELVRDVVADGWSVRFLVINPADAPLAADAVRRAGVPGESTEIRATPTVPEYLAAVGECTVLVAERLHALVLGAAAAVPLIGLEYQPKCADFLGSVGGEAQSFRTDQVTFGRLRAQLDEFAAHREAEASRLRNRVEGLRVLLREELARIGAAVAVPVGGGSR